MSKQASKGGVKGRPLPPDVERGIRRLLHEHRDWSDKQIRDWIQRELDCSVDPETVRRRRKAMRLPTATEVRRMKVGRETGGVSGLSETTVRRLISYMVVPAPWTISGDLARGPDGLRTTGKGRSRLRVVRKDGRISACWLQESEEADFLAHVETAVVGDAGERLTVRYRELRDRVVDYVGRAAGYNLRLEEGLEAVNYDIASAMRAGLSFPLKVEELDALTKPGDAPPAGRGGKRPTRKEPRHPGQKLVWDLIHEADDLRDQVRRFAADVLIALGL